MKQIMIIVPALIASLLFSSCTEENYYEIEEKTPCARMQYNGVFRITKNSANISASIEFVNSKKGVEKKVYLCVYGEGGMNPIQKYEYTTRFNQLSIQKVIDNLEPFHGYDIRFFLGEIEEANIFYFDSFATLKGQENIIYERKSYAYDISTKKAGFQKSFYYSFKTRAKINKERIRYSIGLEENSAWEAVKAIKILDKNGVILIQKTLDKDDWIIKNSSKKICETRFNIDYSIKTFSQEEFYIYLELADGVEDQDIDQWVDFRYTDQKGVVQYSSIDLKESSIE